MGQAAPDARDDDSRILQGMRVGWLDGTPPSYWFTRFVFLRGLGIIHVVAFAVLAHQWRPLIGERGLLPAGAFVERMAERGFWDWPTLFHFGTSDAVLGVAAWLGLGLALAVALGVDHVLVVVALWLLQISFSHVGQIFWGYGWEILLLEVTFLAVFLAPVRGWRSLAGPVAPSPVVIWLLRWLVFRVMFGAGMIKLRGDPCWTELTCLAFHYETQPVPSPVSWLLHQAPLWFHQAGVLFNHFAELVVPFGVFGPRRLRHFAGLVLVAFQLMLIVSGNLSFLNWLTLVCCIPCFDDGALGRLLPARLRARSAELERTRASSRPVWVVSGLLAAVVAVLSYGPVTNMLSPRQAMNTSFDVLHLVNSYGAFGSVGQVRREVILQGTRDSTPGPDSAWLEYEFPCKPGDVERRPCLITPYHFRLDWQMWFAALGEPGGQPWLLHLVHKLLQGEPGATRLLAGDPFEGDPPHFIRGELYEYRYTTIGDGRSAWWERSHVGPYFRPLSRGDPALRAYLGQHGLAPDGL